MKNIVWRRRVRNMNGSKFRRLYRYLHTVNRDPIEGYPAGTLLMVCVTANQRRRGWEVVIELAPAATHNTRWLLPDTGRYKVFKMHEELDFKPLRHFGAAR